jgi:hypothetical protein
VFRKERFYIIVTKRITRSKLVKNYGVEVKTKRLRNNNFIKEIERCLIKKYGLRKKRKKHNY